MADMDSAKQLYSSRIIQLWLEAIDVSQEAQVFFLRGENENEITLEYIARLVRLWREFVPKVQNRAELKELEREFMEFAPLCADPKQFITDPDKIIALEAVLTKVLDRLDITSLTMK